MPAISAFRRPVRKAVIDGKEWYSLADICTRLKADRGYWPGQLGDHARQVAVEGENVEFAPWFVDDEGFARIALASRAPALAGFRTRCNERLAGDAEVRRDAIKTVLALDGTTRKSDKAVTAEEVRSWRRMREEDGLNFNQIQKRTGRSRSLIMLYLDPAKAPAWAKKEIYGQAD